MFQVNSFHSADLKLNFQLMTSMNMKGPRILDSVSLPHVSSDLASGTSHPLVIYISLRFFLLLLFRNLHGVQGRISGHLSSWFLLKLFIQAMFCFFSVRISRKLSSLSLLINGHHVSSSLTKGEITQIISFQTS